MNACDEHIAELRKLFATPEVQAKVMALDDDRRMLFAELDALVERIHQLTPHHERTRTSTE
jgi:hypothetical protein